MTMLNRAKHNALFGRRYRRWSLRLAVACTALAAVLAWSNRAQAQDVLRPGTKPVFATFGLGPSIIITPGSTAQLKLSQEIGYHFSGDASGPALGFSIEEAFINFFRLELGPKFWYDIQPSKDLGIYITPSARLGYAMGTVSYGYYGSGTSHAFNMQFAAALRMVLGDVGLIYFQPITLDMAIAENFGMGWDIMFGGGVIF